MWIPVGEYNVTNAVDSDGTKDGKMTNALSRRTFTSSGSTPVSGDNAIAGTYATQYNEYFYGEGNSDSVAKNQIGAFKTSATSHGGFYIGCYEQGEGNVCKAGVTPYVSITRDQAKAQAESMYSSNSEIKATTQLISSYAWDTALNFICQTNIEGYTLATTTSSSHGNINTGSRKNTGVDAKDNYSNIHDLLGNCIEWTTEYTSRNPSGPCVSRGGRYSDSGLYAAYRVCGDLDMVKESAFRLDFKCVLSKKCEFIDDANLQSLLFCEEKDVKIYLTSKTIGQSCSKKTRSSFPSLYSFLNTLPIHLMIKFLLLLANLSVFL